MAIFDVKFVEAVQSVATELCLEAEATRAKGEHACVTREGIVQRACLATDSDIPNSDYTPFMVNVLLDSGLITGFKSIRGQYGGIRRVDEPAVKAADIRKENLKAAKTAEKVAAKAAKVEAKKAAKAAEKAAKAAAKAETPAPEPTAEVTAEPTETVTQ